MLLRSGVVKFGRYAGHIMVPESSHYDKYNNQYVYNRYMPICYGWYIQYVKQYNYKNDGVKYNRCCGLLQCMQNEPIEIIGNIFDNPKLLEI